MTSQADRNAARNQPDSHYKVLRLGMMHDECRRGLLRLELETTGQPHADIFLRLEQREDLHLVFQARTGRVSERIAGAAILLVEEVADAGRVFAADAKFFPHKLVDILSHCLSRLYSQTVDVQIFRELAGVKELLGLDRRALANGDAR